MEWSIRYTHGKRHRRIYTMPEALEMNYSGQSNYTGQHMPMTLLPTGSCHHPFVVIIICQPAMQLDKATTLTFWELVFKLGEQT
jgi:hypothetical protein